MRFLEFTADELDELIEDKEFEEYENGWSKFKWYDYERYLYDANGHPVKDEKGRHLEDPKSKWGVYYPEIDSWITTADEYGGEGMGDDYWVVVTVVPNNPKTNEPDHDSVTPRSFKKSGYYASYDGGEFDGKCREVKPREKTIVVYE